MAADQSDSETVVYIGLGSNVGERRETLRRALAELDAHARLAVGRVSAFIETAPVGGPPQGPFINAAAELRTDLSPGELLRVLQGVEDRFGRRRTVRWGPRTLDFDVLLYGRHVVRTPELTIPHPLMPERRFVLEPLAEIAPDAVHPVLKLTVGELLRRLTEDGGGP